MELCYFLVTEERSLAIFYSYVRYIHIQALMSLLLTSRYRRGCATETGLWLFCFMEYHTLT